MVCLNKRKTTTKYSSEVLLAAVKALKEGKMKRLAAAHKFNVPATTIYVHASGKYSSFGAGAPTILSSAEEKEIVVTVQVLQDIGFGLTKELVGIVIRDYLKYQPAHPNPFHLGIPE